MLDLLSNPELVRSARAQLRPGRMLTTAGVCAALSLTVGYAMYESGPRGSSQWARQYMLLAMGAQMVALTLGGALACLQSVAREKELNTFDFQRVTRLTPLELALGKLFGAPMLAYFVALCLMPAALFGALMAGARPTFVLAAYAMLLLGSIMFHALALMISMLLTRGLSTGGSVLLLLLFSLGSLPDMGILELGRLSPLFALDLAVQSSWAVAGKVGEENVRLMDVFYGMRVHHAIALAFIYLSFTAWFLAGLVRNLKRDPSVYELYSPRQAFALALYVNFLVIGFFRWEANTPLDAQGVLLGLNLMMFFALGLALIYNRDQVRRRLRTVGERAASFLAASWPAPYVLAGTMAAGAAVIVAISGSRLMEKVGSYGFEWSTGLAAYRVAFIGLWIARDTLFIQWMNLTRVRRPLVLAFVYLMVFYTCVGILIATLDPGPPNMPLASVFLPFGIFAMTMKHWNDHADAWLVMLGLQAIFCGVFVFLQRAKLEELARPAVHAPAD